MLGQDLCMALHAQGSAFRALRRPELDVSLSTEELAKLLEGSSVVVNCVAYTAVDQAENEPEEAFRINASFAGKLAAAAEVVGAHFVHISTDYVFSGANSETYRVTDEPSPQSVYGASKRAGEIEVMSKGTRASIFRTAWLYGRHGKSFPKTIIAKLSAGEGLRVVGDQIGSPTWTADLTNLILEHGRLNDWPSIVHATAAGSCSWYEFAQEIAITAGFDPSRISPVSSDEYQTLAKRPPFSVLEREPSQVPGIGNWKERWKVASHDFLDLAD